MNTANAIASMEMALFKLHPSAGDIYSSIISLKEISKKTQDVIIEEASQDQQPVSFKLDGIPVVKPVAPKAYSYNPDKSLQDRVLNIITELDRFSHSSEIMKKIKEYEPNFEPSLSPAFTALKNKGLIKNFTTTGSHRDTRWGLAEWDFTEKSI